MAKKKKKKKRIINNYPVVIHFYVKWSAPSFGGTGFFSQDDNTASYLHIRPWNQI